MINDLNNLNLHTIQKSSKDDFDLRITDKQPTLNDQQ
jgi:hypothetical protein